VAARLLLVEDDAVLRTSLAELLGGEGYDVTCAADGVEGLTRLLHEPPPSVIVLDICMPRIDGFSFRTVQLQTSVVRDVPTIALTSLTEPKVSSFRFDAVVPKRATFDGLLQTVTALCPPPRRAGT